LGDAADQGADFEEEDGDQEDVFDGEEGVEAAKEELQGGRGEEVGWDSVRGWTGVESAGEKKGMTKVAYRRRTSPRQAETGTGR
jgi:hypothetical protein